MLGASQTRGLRMPSLPANSMLSLDSPGRFFAANELKAMLAYILVNYDFKLPEDGRRPENLYIGEVVLPNPEGEIMFKRRQASLSSYM